MRWNNKFIQIQSSHDYQALPGNTSQLALHKLAWKVMASPRSPHTVLHNTSAQWSLWDQGLKKRQEWVDQSYKAFPPEEIEVLPLAQSLQFEMQGSLDEVAHLLHMKIQIECDLEIHYKFPLRWVKVAEGGLLSVAIVRKNTSVNWTIQPLHRHEEPQVS